MAGRAFRRSASAPKRRALRSHADGGLPRARMTIRGEDRAEHDAGAGARLCRARARDRIVLSAHVDGHPHGESAIDNATGVAVALGVARALAAHAADVARGLRVCLFGAEEWGLAGSRLWLARMAAGRTRAVCVSTSISTRSAAPRRLTALTSGFPALGAWIEQTAARAGLPIATHLPLMPNSDHANFAAAEFPRCPLVRRVRPAGQQPASAAHRRRYARQGAARTNSRGHCIWP